MMVKDHVRCAGLALLSMTSVMWCTHPHGAAEPVDPFVQIKRLGRGVTILGYDPLWDSFANARFKEHHFELIHNAGFQTGPHQLARPSASERLE